MYEINYIDQQFFIITKPQDKNSLNWPVGSGHSCIQLQIYFFIMKKLSTLTTGMEVWADNPQSKDKTTNKYKKRYVSYSYIFRYVVLFNIFMHVFSLD